MSLSTTLTTTKTITKSWISRQKIDAVETSGVDSGDGRAFSDDNDNEKDEYASEQEHTVTVTMTRGADESVVTRTLVLESVRPEPQMTAGNVDGGELGHGAEK